MATTEAEIYSMLEGMRADSNNTVADMIAAASEQNINPALLANVLSTKYDGISRDLADKAISDIYGLQTTTPIASPVTQDWQSQGMAGDYKSLDDGDWEALQKSIYDASVAGLGRQEELARAASNQSMSNRGIWSSGIAERAQNDITGQLGAAYEQAGANAATQRYNLQNSDNQAYNQYNLSNQSLGNQYYLGRESNANTAQSIANQYALGQGQLALGQGQLDLGNLTQNDNYALSRAGLLNDANAQASNAQWQAQWAPANFLSGMWNGTGGTISSGSSGGGWNFMI